MPTHSDVPSVVLLAADALPLSWDLHRTVRTDPRFPGAVSGHDASSVRRVEPGPHGPMLLSARAEGAVLRLHVHGPAQTPAEYAERALNAAAAWAGASDDARAGAEAAATHPVTRHLWAAVGPVRMSAIPRVGEAVSRAIIAQLVQQYEAMRSGAQLVQLAGTPGPQGLACWPTPAQMRGMPSWELRRRCGLSLRNSTSLHAAAEVDRRLEADRHVAERFAARMHRLPGVGAWTIGESRLYLGDPNAVAAGDFHLPSVVGTAVTGWHRLRAEWSDEEMLTQVEASTGYRGRLVRLCQLGAMPRLVARQHRRAPRARLSAHRYW